MGDGEGGEAQIGLGLAAAGREEQEIDQLAIGVRLLGEAVEIEQDEGELERPPDRGSGRRIEHRAARSAEAMARLAIRKASRARGSLRSR